MTAKSAPSAFPLFDLAHLGLILLTFGIAYLLPFQLILLAYAVLGPAHYLTEISWLHERSYFLPSRFFAMALLGATALMVLLRGNFGATSFILIFLLSVSGAMAFTADRTARVIIAGVGSILGLAVASYG